MAFEGFANRLHRRLYRRTYRNTVRRWIADGGDYDLRFNYPLNERSLVLDIGGYEGQWASDLYARYRCRILIFEPVRIFARRIADRFRNNPEIAVFECGLGASSRTEAIYVRGASSSTHRKRSDSQLIEIVDVRKWFSDNHVGPVQLMKINIEGGEYELLERLIETGLIGSVDDIQVQFHNFTPDAPRRMRAIRRELQKTHAPTYQYEFVWENWKRIPDSVE